MDPGGHSAAHTNRTFRSRSDTVVPQRIPFRNGLILCVMSASVDRLLPSRNYEKIGRVGVALFGRIFGVGLLPKQGYQPLLKRGLSSSPILLCIIFSNLFGKFRGLSPRFFLFALEEYRLGCGPVWGLTTSAYQRG